MQDLHIYPNENPILTVNTVNGNLIIHGKDCTRQECKCGACKSLTRK